VRSVDPLTATAETEIGRLSYDVLSVIPPNRAMPFIGAAGLGAPFVEVDPKTLRSSHDERIYAIGDNADTPYAKTGYTAMNSALVAAASIASDIGVRVEGPAPPENLCFPMVDADRALRIETHWTLGQDATGAVQVRVSGSHDETARSSYARLRREWEVRALSSLFGR